MAYDGKIMRLALQEFEKDKNAREAELRDRRERIFQRQPRLRQIEGELHATMSRIISGALRRGTDPRPAIAALREENLSLQAEKRELLGRMARYVRDKEIDLVLLAGDLFDSAGLYQETWEALESALAAMACPVFIAPGNHDCCAPGSPYDAGRWPPPGPG